MLRQLSLFLFTASFISCTRIRSLKGSEERACNGQTYLCNRTLSQVAILGTHNSYAAQDYGFVDILSFQVANQKNNIVRQLNDGVRALSLDIYSGETPGRVVLQHKVAALGSIDFIEVCTSITGWLDDNPNEVIYILMEDLADPTSIKNGIVAAGLDKYAHTFDADKQLTLGEMIDKGERVVFVRQDCYGCTSSDLRYYLAGPKPEADQTLCEVPAWLQTRQHVSTETHFELGNDKPWQEDYVDWRLSCSPAWGPASNPIYVLNNFIYLTFDPAINSWDTLFNRTYECWARYGRFPNILLVDQHHQGDAAKVVKWLNDIYVVGPVPPENVYSEPPSLPPPPSSPPLPASPPPGTRTSTGSPAGSSTQMESPSASSASTASVHALVLLVAVVGAHLVAGL